MSLWKTAAPFVVAVAAFADSAFAGGGFLQTLPKDGTWVTYNMEMKAEEGPMQEMSGTMKLKSVGTVKEKGKTYRWLEIEMRGEQNGMKQHTILKALIGEKELKPGAKGELEILRGWQQNTRGDTKMDPKELSAAELGGRGPLAMFFGTRLKDQKTVKQTKTIAYQKGELKIASAVAGDVQIELNENAPKDFKQSMRQTIWKHKSIPTGTAAIEMQMEISRQDKLLAKFKMVFNVQDFGKDAKSALPDKK